MVTDIRKSALWAIVILLAAGLSTATVGLVVIAADADPWRSPALLALEYFWSIHLLLLEATGLLAVPVESAFHVAIWVGCVVAVWFLAWTVICQLARAGYRKILKQRISHPEVNR